MITQRLLRGVWGLLLLSACVSATTGRCSLFGRHSVQTFDRVLYTFPGKCSYFLAGDCNHHTFTILGDFIDGKRTGVTLYLGEDFELHLSVDGLLTQNERRIPLPYASHSVFVGSELGYYKLWSEEFGFSVTIDSATNVAVTLTKNHNNRTCGLCGNFNSVQADDYTAQEGFLTEHSYDFANSWAVSGPLTVCQRVSKPSKYCNGTKPTTETFTDCNLLKNSKVFQQCASVVSPEDFQLLCQEEACHCRQKNTEDCYCSILLEYVRTCNTKGILLRGWQEESQCFPKCPIGMQYSECTKACSTNCHSLNIQEVCKDECVDGCTCPKGMVLDGRRCVEVLQCSCVHMGQHFPPGSTVSQNCNTCVCRHGSWECTNEGCPGECLVVGQSHFKTFDNKFFTFSGQCQYLLARDCAEGEFSVIIDIVQCANDEAATCTRAVTLSLPSLDNMIIKLKHGGLISVNGFDIQTPMHHGRLQIQRSVQSSVRVKLGEDLRLEWDGRGRLFLKLSPRWAGQTCGLCGNFNGNRGDDFLCDSGLVEAGPQAFGHSWRINADCESPHRHEVDPCSLNPKRVRFAEEACAVMTTDAFSPCYVLVNPAPFRRFCRYDVCACVDGEECLCSALAAYAAVCAAHGVLLNWRTPSLCALECPEGQVYETCGNLCDRTCQALSGAEAGCDGDRLCEEGCFCPPGKYLSDTGECVTADQCPCLHDGQLYQPGDVYADHKSVCYCEKGSMTCSSPEMNNMLSDLFYKDDWPSVRERRSAQCPPPLLRTECGRGEKGIECARTCQNLDFPCVSPTCIPGCLCPPGMVHHGRGCILPEQCPCYHNNRAYSSGQVISVDCNTCVCNNRRWNCTGKVCDGVCRTVAEGHYITFDGFKYSFTGLCQYVLVQDTCNGEEGSFRVLIENEACGIAGHHCAKTVTVFYNGGLILMQQGEVKMKRPVLQGSQVEIVRSGQFYTVLLGKHISISWDRRTMLLVHISASYRGRVCGLCGNFDGNINNDLVSSNNQLEVDPSHFGNSWKVHPSCADVTEVPSPCGDNVIKLLTVEQSCHVITGPLFRDCNSQVDPEPFSEMCVESACSCTSVGNCACFCDVIAAYAQICSEKGIAVSWRSNDLCPMSCEELNPKIPGTGEELCQWRYNSCGPACPITCQHPDRLQCWLSCVEGCHPTCRPGQVLDEVSLQCVDPSHCQVCIHDGERIPHDNKVIFNHDDPELCKICQCGNNTLSCEDCTSLKMSVIPTMTPTQMTTLPFTTAMPEGQCDRAMDLAFLLDGSQALNEEEFLQTKKFILGVISRFRMGSAHTRATVLVYHSGVKTYDLQVQKLRFKKMVGDLHYTGGDVAFLDEAIKYLGVNIYDKNKRPNADRVAIILTASANPRAVSNSVKLLKKKAITTLTVALGPFVNLGQINDITKIHPGNRAYILNSPAELSDNLLGLTDHLCTLGKEPEVPKAAVTKTPPRQPNPTHLVPSIPTLAAPSKLAPVPSISSSTTSVRDVTFIIEGSDSVGEENFNKSLSFINDVVTQMTVKEEVIRITVIQYSVTVTVEISGWELTRQRTMLLQRLKEIRWRGGSQTNTGTAVVQTLKKTHITQTSQGHTRPDLVFLVTANPPTDTVELSSSSTTYTQVQSIGVGPKVNEEILFKYSFPNRPIMVPAYNNLTNLVPLIINITKTRVSLQSPTLPPLVVSTLSSLPSSVPCKKPVDVLFLLKAGKQFEDMKTFVKLFIRNADIGIKDTQVSVVQYGDINMAEVAWKDGQSKSKLLKLLEGIQSMSTTRSNLGSALQFAVRMSISSSFGGRVGIPKAVVMLVTDKSTDDVKEAVNEALAAGVSVFPIGVGPYYDRQELELLGHHGNQENILHINSMDNLLTLLTLDHGYTERICRAGPPAVCVDDNGIERKPGETWLLEDGCHFLLCHPSGKVVMQNHKVNCDRLEPPVCRQNITPVKVRDACGCHWECPCMCMGSSTNHVVRFDGLALRLDREGQCSYTLLSIGSSVNEGSEIKLHSGSCQNSEAFNNMCMKVIEVIQGTHKLLLNDDMTAVFDGEELAFPWRHGGLELVRFGGVMLQLKSDNGYVLSFTPQSNEFTITMLDSSNSSFTAGLCGGCQQEHVNNLSLRNGSTTTDKPAFITDWTTAGDAYVCVPKQKLLCMRSAATGCQALRLEAFEPCHSHIPVHVFLSKCEEQACDESDVCEIISAYARLCRQRGICVNWRSPRLCPLSCPSSMEYDACRTGCVEDCGSVLTSRGDLPFASRNESSCMETPAEGCFCAGGMIWHHGQCVSPEVCRQCVDHLGHAHKYMDSWVPAENPCMICMCLNQQRINCTARPCNDVKPPICGPCEVLKEERGTSCCPEFKCVCDPVNCKHPEIPRCEDGQTLVLENPGECKPIHMCVCNRTECPLQAPPACPAHRRLVVKKSKCCDMFECVCSCTNSTNTCQVGFIMSSKVNDCGCVEVSCVPDKVCVVGEVIHVVGSEWKEGCETCSCTQLQDKRTSLHLAQCTPPVCDQMCPQGSTYTSIAGECCGKCTPSSCLVSKASMRGDTMIGGQLRNVGEKWTSPNDRCVQHECVKVGNEVFITASNVSCSTLETSSCPLGTELRCDTRDCCPHCHCAPLNVCVLNNTIIGAGEQLMVDLCTRCDCTVEGSAVRKARLSCRRTHCPVCPKGYTLQKEEDACCGRCVATDCFIQGSAGEVISMQVNTTREDGCNSYTCSVNWKGELILQTKVTTCPPFNRQACIDEGGKISQIGTTCCEICTEPQCRKMVGTLNYIKVEDCQSEQQIEINYCEGKCHSKSMYSLERLAVEQECVCCAALQTEPIAVPLLCANGTRSHHTVLSVTACDCLSKHCA